MIYYIYASNTQNLVEEVKKLALLPADVRYLNLEDFLGQKIEDATHFLCSGSIQDIKQVIPTALALDVTLGIIPKPNQKDLIQTFALPSRLEEAVKLALKKSEEKIDLLYCNNNIVLQEAVIGEAPPLDQFERTVDEKSWGDRIRIFWQTLLRVKKLRHTKMKITVANGNEMKLSAVGVVGIEYNNNTFASKLIASELSAMDGKSTIVILAPRSILEYIAYLFTSLVSFITPKKLPPSVGFIRSSLIDIDTARPLPIVIDSYPAGKSPASMETKQCVLRLSVGEKFWERNKKEKNTKETIKVDHLPQDDEIISYLSEGIPLFPHASREQYAALFKNLREESRLSTTFMVLLILATMIATFGLFINSSSVIIGAMLLAPLMQPIVSFSMGVLRQDNTLLANGAKSIVVGVLAVLFTAAFIALLTPIERLTPEMAARLSPTILDLYIAIVSGVAAAYVKTNEKIQGSLAGVAIAVALVPPITVAGIGLGWGNWHIFSTAFLLFITNLVGIVFAAALTFTVLGFSPLHLAKKGVMVWIMIVMLVAIPLQQSFKQMKEDTEIQKILAGQTFMLQKHKVKLTDVKVLHHSKKDKLNCKVISTGILNPKEKVILKEKILQRVKRDVDVVASFIYAL